MNLSCLALTSTLIPALFHHEFTKKKACPGMRSMPSSTRGLAEREFRTMWCAFGLIPPSCRSLVVHLNDARDWPRWSCVKASWKLGNGPSGGARTRLQKSIYPPHSGGLKIEPSHILSDIPFVSTMTLKALENTHSHHASLPILESQPSSP